MQLSNNRVWDYAGDNYVHRLVQNKSDGKMVRVGDERDDNLGDDEKLDSIALEVRKYRKEDLVMTVWNVVITYNPRLLRVLSVKPRQQLRCKGLTEGFVAGYGRFLSNIRYSHTTIYDKKE